jgi:hypothetical protein
MFKKQVKVNGDYVKGIIIDGQMRTGQLITINVTKPISLSEINGIIEELILLKKEMEKTE